MHNHTSRLKEVVHVVYFCRDDNGVVWKFGYKLPFSEVLQQVELVYDTSGFPIGNDLVEAEYIEYSVGREMKYDLIGLDLEP